METQQVIPTHSYTSIWAGAEGSVGGPPSVFTMGSASNGQVGALSAFAASTAISVDKLSCKAAELEAVQQELQTKRTALKAAQQERDEAWTFASDATNALGTEELGRVKAEGLLCLLYEEYEALEAALNNGHEALRVKESELQTKGDALKFALQERNELKVLALVVAAALARAHKRYHPTPEELALVNSKPDQYQYQYQYQYQDQDQDQDQDHVLVQGGGGGDVEMLKLSGGQGGSGGFVTQAQLNQSQSALQAQLSQTQAELEALRAAVMRLDPSVLTPAARGPAPSSPRLSLGLAGAGAGAGDDPIVFGENPLHHHQPIGPAPGSAHLRLLLSPMPPMTASRSSTSSCCSSASVWRRQRSGGILLALGPRASLFSLEPPMAVALARAVPTDGRPSLPRR